MTITRIIEVIQTTKAKGKLKYFNLTIILVRDGSEHPVLVPRNMNVGMFAELAYKRVLLPRFKPIIPKEHFILEIFVHRGDDLVKVPSNRTIKESKLQEGDTCKLVGKIINKSLFFVEGSNDQEELYMLNAPRYKIPDFRHEESYYFEEIYESTEEWQAFVTAFEKKLQEKV